MCIYVMGYIVYSAITELIALFGIDPIVLVLFMLLACWFKSVWAVRDISLTLVIMSLPKCLWSNPEQTLLTFCVTGGNRTMVAAATIVIMAAAKKAQQHVSLCTTLL